MFGIRDYTLFKKSINGRKALYIDNENGYLILQYLNDDKSNLKKFHMIVELILEGRPSRDLYDKENFEKGCEHITAMKLFKGKKESQNLLPAIQEQGARSVCNSGFRIA